ncbi:hypothetical protein ACHAXT_007119 [Thalassiosira profunda]
MDDLREQSAMTIESIEQNSTLSHVCIEGAGYIEFSFGLKVYPSDGVELARLGRAIGGNTHLGSIAISFLDPSLATIMHGNSAFFEGLRRNSSVKRLCIEHGHDMNISEGICGEILDELVANNVNLTSLSFYDCSLTGGVRDLASAVTTCRNLKNITFMRGGVVERVPYDDTVMEEMVSTGMLHQLNEVSVRGLKLGIAGFRALANLLQDPQCDLTRLMLAFMSDQNADDRYAEMLADSLRRNRRLKLLDLPSLDVTEDGWDAFSTALCDTSDANRTYLSNHTLSEISGLNNMPAGVARLLRMNEEGHDEKRIAMKKVVLNHYLNVEPLLEWDLKALPLAINWFEKAATLASQEGSGCEHVNVEAEKLSAIYQFARSLPLMFVPSKKCTGKRRAGEISN